MKNRRGFRRNLQRIRHLSQLLFFVLFVGIIFGSVCSFVLGGVEVVEPLGAIQLFLAAGAGSTSGILITVGIAASIFVSVTLLVGKAWCGWACPIGSVVEFSEYAMDRAGIRAGKRISNRRKNGRLRRIFRLSETKYTVLGGVLASAAITRSPNWCNFCPIGTVCRGTVAGHLVAGTELLVVGAVAGSSFYERRFFCKYLCPVAGLLALISRANPFLKPKVDRENCPDCKACDYLCPMGIRVSHERTFSECTKCFVCYSTCPYGAVGASLFQPRARLQRPSVTQTSQ